MLKLVLVVLTAVVLVVAVSFDYIENDPNYPENKLNDLPLWKYQFKSNVREKRENQQFLVETKLCDSKISFKQPQKLRNIKNKWRTIINHGNYSQFVRFEECSSLNFPCTYNIYPQQVRSFCQQNYLKIDLWAMDDAANCLVMEKFHIPSSCDCMIEKEDFFKGVSKDLL